MIRSFVTRFFFLQRFIPLLILLFAGAIRDSHAQVTISTGGTGALTTFRPGHCLITFVITNNNTAPVTLTDVGCLQSRPSGPPANPQYTLWYHTTSLNGTPDISTANGWVQGPSQVKPWPPAGSASVIDVLTNISITIPAGATYRFALESSNRLVYGMGLSPSSFTNGNITLYRGGTPYKGYAGDFSKPADTISSTDFIGYVKFNTGPPCDQPDMPVVIVTPAGTCPNGNAVLSIISGNLNDATNWHWYSGSCGGTPLGTGASVSVNPAATTTYYVRGEGGCVTPGSCRNVTVPVHPAYKDTVQTAICAGQSYLFNGSPLTAPGTYNVALTSVNGCDSLVTLQLSVVNPVSRTVYDTICAGDTYLFDGSALSSAGIYQAVFSSTGGCDSTVTLHLSVSPRPLAPATEDTVNYCQHEPASMLTAAGQELLWYETAAGGAGTTTAPVPLTGIPGIFTWYVSQTINGCESSRSKIVARVTEKPEAAISIEADTVCLYDTLDLHIAGGGIPGVAYSWDIPGGVMTGEITSGVQVVYATPGIKEIRLTATRDGCDSIVIRTLYVYPPPAYQLFAPDAGCVGDIVKVILTHSEGAGGQYSFNTGGGTLVSGDLRTLWEIRWNTAGTKEIRLNVNGQCSRASLSRMIEIHELPDISIHAGRNEICAGDSVSLTTASFSGYRYQWSRGTYFPDNNAPDVFARVYQDTWLQLEITDSIGCRAADSILVTTRPCCDLFVPNAFSPNGDGKNDIFRPLGTGLYQNYILRVFNRWGQMVFSSMQQQTGWNGITNGMAQEIGAYYYHVRYECSDGQQYEQRGDVQLIR